MKTALLAVVALLCATPARADPAPPTPREKARIQRILHRSPVIDGHNDLPWEIRENYGGDIGRVDLRTDTRKLSSPMHTDIPPPAR